MPGRAFWIVADPDTGTIYTALANTNLIAKLRVDGAGKPVLVSTVPTVRNPISFDMDMSTGTLYVGGYADSQLQIIPASAFEARGRRPGDPFRRAPGRRSVAVAEQEALARRELGLRAVARRAEVARRVHRLGAAVGGVLDRRDRRVGCLVRVAW